MNERNEWKRGRAQSTTGHNRRRCGGGRSQNGISGLMDRERNQSG